MALDFSRNYSPPGVYISEDESTLVSVTGIPPSLVALCGPARGYQVNTEQVPLNDVGVRLRKQGIDTTTATVVVAASGAPVPITDYSLTEVPGSPTDQSYYTDLLIAASPETDDGTIVNITYRYTDPEYYAPKRFESFEDVKDVYGEPLNLAVATPGDATYQYVLSPVSLAAMVAFQDGASDLVICAATPPPSSATTDAAKSTARRTALAQAYDKVSTDNTVNLLVGITTGIADEDAPGALIDLSTAVNDATNDGFYRFGIIGFDTPVDTAPDDLLATSGVINRRVMLAYAGPSGLLMYSGPGNSFFSVGHEFLAAAYAGRMAALPVQYSITKSVIAGFSGLAGTPLSNSLKNQYASSGIAVTEVDRFTRLVVRHAVTTDVTNVNTREAAVVRAKDAMVTALADGTATSGLLGAPVDDDLLLSIKSAVQGILENAVTESTINSYSGLAVRQTSTDPTVVEVKFAYKPAYPLNYIVVSFSIDMSTGDVSLNTDDTLV